MIEFTGDLTGEAKERVLEKTFQYERNSALIALLILLPIMIIIAIRIEMWELLLGHGALFLFLALLPGFPQSKKEKQALIPQRIYTDGKTIVCITEKGQIERRIRDVKTVYDCKTYYEVTFKFGKLSSQFICQKDLMTKGTIEEFEALFEGKFDDMSDEF